MATTWEITPGDYFERLHLDIKEFEKRLHLPDVSEIKKIVPLRRITKIHSLIPITAEMLGYLVRRIKTLDGDLPYKNAHIKMAKMDPHILKIGQKFVYRENYQQLMEEVPGIFKEFMGTSEGLADIGAYFVFGVNGNTDTLCLACYLPPIVEQHSWGLPVMDGIHRNFLSKQSGAIPTTILVKNVELPFPCAAQNWSKVEVIPLADKPVQVEDRYFELNKGLFRNLKYLGIDG